MSAKYRYFDQYNATIPTIVINKMFYTTQREREREHVRGKFP